MIGEVLCLIQLKFFYVLLFLSSLYFLKVLFLIPIDFSTFCFLCRKSGTLFPLFYLVFLYK